MSSSSPSGTHGDYPTVGVAARLGDLGKVQYMLAQGRDIDDKDNQGWRPIHQASYHNKPGCLALLLRHRKVNLNWRSYAEETSLLLAARKGNTECLRLLLNHGADPNRATHEGFTPLWEAVQAKNSPCIKMLLRKGAKINRKIYTGASVLNHAAETGQLDLLVYLLRHRAKLNVFEDFHIGPIFLAARGGHYECLQVLLQVAEERGQGDLVNESASDGATPLLLAAQEGHSTCVRLLLNMGANPDLCTKDNRIAPLHLAVKNFRLECVELLCPVTKLELLEDSYRSCHPFLFCLTHPNAVCLKMLVSAGLDPTKRFSIFDSFDGYESNYLFSEQGLKYSPKTSLLSLLAFEDLLTEYSIAEELTNYPDCIDVQDPCELSPLIAAIYQQRVCLSLFLWRKGVNVHIYHPAVCGNVAVLFAIQNIFRNAPLASANLAYFLCPLLVGGANASSSFLSSENVPDCKMSLKQLIRIFFTPNNYYLHSLTSQAVTLVFLTLICFSWNVTLSIEGAEDCLDEDARFQIKQMKESSQTLMHLCRKTIIKTLTLCKTYSEDGLKPLMLPHTINNYLLLTSYGRNGKLIVDAFNMLPGDNCLITPHFMHS